MRILVLGEGPNDLGRIGVDGSCAQLGVVPILVTRILNEQFPDTEIEFDLVRWTRVGTHRGSGFDRKLELAFAQQRGQTATAIVGFVDRDGPDNHSRIEQLMAGRASLLAARKPCAVGVAVEMLESLLLADEITLRIALANPSIACQAAPEGMSGKRRNAKTALQELIELSPAWKDSNDFTKHYANIATHAASTLLNIVANVAFVRLRNS